MPHQTGHGGDSGHGTPKRVWFAIFAVLLGSLIAQPSAAQVPPSETQPAAPAPPPVPPAPQQTMPLWPKDAVPVKWDWIQLTTNEWLKGRLLGMYDKSIDFDSDKLDRVTYDWYDIRQVRTAEAMEVGLINGAVAVGKLVVVDSAATIIGDGSLDLQRYEIMTITPWAKKSALRRWTGKIDLGATVLRGNTDQVDANFRANLKHRNVRDRIVFDAISNFSRAASIDIADNRRLTGDWDHFITNRWFVKPVGLELYSDPFQNLDLRTTVGLGAGYQIIDTRKTQWQFSSGVGYQSTRFKNVEEGEDPSSHTGSIGASTKYEHKWSKSLELTYEYTFQLTKKSSGQYNHHMLAMLETKWTRILDFDVTLVWDRTQLPQPGSDGVTPKQDDFRMVVALGIEF